jgi:hypothetical protein
MPTRPSREHKWQTPVAPWSRGDFPEPGKVQLDIFVTGRRLGPGFDYETGLLRQFDAHVAFDRDGNFPITDSRDNNKTVWAQGHKFARWLL